MLLEILYFKKMKTNTNTKPKEDDCKCGRRVKITERKKIIYKKTIKKR